MIGDAMPQFLMRIFSISVLCLFISPIFVHSLSSNPVSTASPSVVISITLGYPGKSVKLNGNGFGHSEMVTLYFDTTQVGTNTTTNTGTFVTTIKVPSSAQPGGHIVQAFGQISGGYAQASFLVQTNWVMFGDGPYHTHFNQYENVINTTNVANLVPDWSYPTGNSILSSPAVTNGLIYIGSDDHKLYALNATTGAFVWSYTTGNMIYSSPIVTNGVVYAFHLPGTTP
jgi:outer membrane protein assembly factor BamB